MSVTCPVCHVRRGPCLDSWGNPIEQYHLARVRAESRRGVDHAAEAMRLRAAQKGAGK